MPAYLSVRVQSEPFNQATEYNTIQESCLHAGAIVSFCGLVRDQNLQQPVTELFLQHYEGMTESLIEELCSEAIEKWSLDGAHVVHRVGALKPNDLIVFVATASAHRGAAFESCQYVIDQLKTRATFWKRETYPEGSRWLDDREEDHTTAEQWKK